MDSQGRADGTLFRVLLPLQTPGAPRRAHGHDPPGQGGDATTRHRATGHGPYEDRRSRLHSVAQALLGSHAAPQKTDRATTKPGSSLK